MQHRQDNWIDTIHILIVNIQFFMELHLDFCQGDSRSDDANEDRFGWEPNSNFRKIKEPTVDAGCSQDRP